MGKLLSRPKAPPIPKPVEMPAYTPPPEPKPVPALPDPDDNAILMEKKKQYQKKQTGRASTFLSDNEDALG